MKANLDLTQHRDFDPDKFKVKKIRSKYNDGYSLNKVPWSNNGDILSKYTNIYSKTYWYINDIVNNNWTSPALTTNITNIYSQLVDYGMTTNTVFTDTISYDNNIGMLYNSLMFKHSKQSGLRIGKVKDIRYTRYMNDYIPAYSNNKRAYCNKSRSSDDRNYNSYKIHRKIKDGYNPNDYDPKYYSVDIRDDFNIEDQSINLIDKHIDARGMLAHKKVILSNSGRRGHHTPFEDKFRVIKKMKWFDNHDDYLREMEGNTVRHQWRGITDKNYNGSNDDTRLTITDNWSTVSVV